MGSHKGFLYEKNATEYLKRQRIVDPDFVSPGNEDEPDLEIRKGDKKTFCELKIKCASAGSLVLKYDSGWSFADTTSPLLYVAKEFKLFDVLQDTWSSKPYRFTPLYSESKAECYKKDKSAFREIKQSVTADCIGLYYRTKGAQYINIGTHGLYHFGTDVFGLGVRNFADCAEVWYRARVQYKKKSSYQFTFELAFKMNCHSVYNLAPLISRRDVNIKESNMEWYYA